MMPTIVMQCLEIAKSNLPRLVKELKRMNELKAIEIKAKAGLVAATDTVEAVDAVMEG